MRPRNRLAYRLALPLAFVVGPAPGVGAGPIVAHSVVPAGESPDPSIPKPKPKAVEKGARVSGRPGNGAALPSSPPGGRSASLAEEDRRPSGLDDPSVPRAKDEVNEVTSLDQVPSSAHSLPSGGLLLLPLPPDPEPGESKTYAGEPSGTTGAAVGEVASPSGAHDALPLPRGPEEASTPGDPVTSSLPGTPAASAVERMPGDREAIPSASTNSTDRGAVDPAPVLQAPRGADAKASPSTAGAVVGSPNAANAPLGSSAVGSTVKDSGGAGTASAETPGGASGPASPPPIQDPGGAKPTGIATEAGASGRSTGVPADSHTHAVASAPGPVSSGSGGTSNEAAHGGGETSSMDKATAFGQMLTTAVLAQELSNPGWTGGGGSQIEPSKDKSSLAMSDRALLAEVGGTTPLDANSGASGDVGGVNPLAPGGVTTAPSAPSVPLGPDLPLPAVEAGEGVRQAVDPGAMSGTPLSPSISPRAIPEPTPLVQVVVVLTGSAFVIARRRSQRGPAGGLTIVGHSFEDDAARS